MREEDIYKKLFGFGSSTTYYAWKKEENKRKIMSLITKYFTKEDLESYILTQSIPKYDQFNQYTHNISFQYSEFILEIKDDNFKICVYFEFLRFINKEEAYKDNLFKYGVLDVSYIKNLLFRYYAMAIDFEHPLDEQIATEEVMLLIGSLDNSLLMFIVSSYRSNFNIFYNELLSKKFPLNLGVEEIEFIKFKHEYFFQASNKDENLVELSYELDEMEREIENNYSDELGHVITDYEKKDELSRRLKKLINNLQGGE